MCLQLGQKMIHNCDFPVTAAQSLRENLLGVYSSFSTLYSGCLHLVIMLCFVLKLSACMALYSRTTNFAMNTEIFRLPQCSLNLLGGGVCRTLQSIPVLKLQTNSGDMFCWESHRAYSSDASDACGTCKWSKRAAGQTGGSC